jgi:PAS domain S-box-containing protein
MLVLKGYSLGAVDYLIKPIDPEILISKVAVFVDLFKKTAEVKLQAAQLQAINAELKKSEEQFHCLSACSPVGIFMTDIQGCCTYTNSLCQATHNFTLGESCSEGWSRSVHPEDRDWVLADWSARTLKGQEYESEFRLLTQSGIVSWVHVRSSPMLSDKGELIGHIGTVEDVTERKLAESARQKQAELERLNQLKDEFLNTVSHDLRTPMTNIKMALQMLKVSDTVEKVQYYVEILQAECDREIELLNDILDLQRLEAACYRLSLSDAVNLQEWLPNVVERFTARTQERQQTLQIDLPPDMPPLLSDSASLERMLAELLNNACKYTPAGGEIVLSVRHNFSSETLPRGTGQTSSLHQPSQQLLDTPESLPCPSLGNSKPAMTPDSPPVTIFTISNSAEIPAAELPRIFEKFYRVPKADPWKQGGTGLGLALVQKLVSRLQGTIEVESSRGWTTFTVELPNQPRA